ncbi:solute carrier family 52, riboflavin transporter, member 3-B-like [Haliotis rufescens]|uniref:solute carrier family 52, riboflavin transporter, member 3-B-like n=1 Tax=Haliotis rufescens TaxID=6454 RepID=UPI00201EDFB0|nr:solute carrier family 52, riboflavin transporter, member 3-B-like [Haliotis rufescens]
MEGSTQRVSVVVYILVIMFGVASWVDINGLWVELPIMVQELPEGWNLPSYMVSLMQLANLGPLIFTLTSVQCPGRLSEKGTIYFIITVGASACVLLVFFWRETAVIGGVRHSVALLSLNFFLAFVDTTSSVAFLPFMAIFKPAYMTAYFIGEGFSGLLPGLMGLAQGAGRVECVNHTVINNVTINGTSFEKEAYHVRPSYVDNNFSIEVFFAFIGGMIVTSGISFTLLSYHPRCKREYAACPPAAANGDDDTDINAKLNDCNGDEIDAKLSDCRKGDRHLIATLVDSEDERIAFRKVGKLPSVSTEDSRGMTRLEYMASLLLTGWINALTNAVLISVQTYSCLPYSTSTYYLTVTLANVANPLASFMAFFVYVTSVHALSVLSLIGSLLGVYIMAAAVMSPYPVLVGTDVGGPLMVSVWVVCVFILTYAKVSLASLFRAEGKKGLLHCGVATQVGSAIGGVSMFVFVTILHLFVMVYPCS